MILQFNDGGTIHSLEVMADSFAELRPAFAEFTRYMRAEVDEVFRTGGNGSWPARSEEADKRQKATVGARIEKIEREKYTSLRGALRSEQRRAERRLAKTPASNSKLTERRRRSVARYEAQAAELERYAQGGQRQAGFKRLYERAGRREQRAAAKIEAVKRGDLLGRIAQSCSVKFDRSSWEMFSNITWAGVHNAGGTVAHGAKIPARTFLEWTLPRLQKFVEIANAYVMKRAARAK